MAFNYIPSSMQSSGLQYGDMGQGKSQEGGGIDLQKLYKIYEQLQGSGSDSGHESSGLGGLGSLLGGLGGLGALGGLGGGSGMSKGVSIPSFGLGGSLLSGGSLSGALPGGKGGAGALLGLGGALGGSLGSGGGISTAGPWGLLASVILKNSK